MIKGEPHVCLCEKRNGKASFPKGGLDGNTVLVGAKREWSEEAGLALSRLQLLQGASLDEARIGCRYLLAHCDLPKPGSDEPDVSNLQWSPPFEDPNDKDPIIKSYWLPVSNVLRGRSKLGQDRCWLVKEAIERLNEGGKFVAA